MSPPVAIRTVFNRMPWFSTSKDYEKTQQAVGYVIDLSKITFYEGTNDPFSGDYGSLTGDEEIDEILLDEDMKEMM